MPRLLSLQIPSAPNADFFEMDFHPLEILVLQAGYDSQNFIGNLGKSKCFPRLRYLDFTDYEETYVEGWKERCAPLEDFRRLLEAGNLNSVKVLVLRNVLYSKEEIEQLQLSRKDISIKRVRTESNYI